MPSVDAASQAPTMAVPASTRARRVSLAAVAVTVAAVIVAAGGVAWWRRGDSSSATRRLAVLPFENLGARDDDYFADGITDEVRGKLAALNGFEVTARSSTAQYKNAASKSPRQIGQELGVEYLLTGTVRWEARQQQGRRVRVSPELVRVSDGTTRWQEAFDTDVSDVFEMQAEIASRVAQALGGALVGGARTSLEEKPTSNVEAYDAFLRGEQVSQSLVVTDPTQLRRAITYYQQAVNLDPNFVQAWAQLGRAACNVTDTSSLGDDLDTCRRAAERASALAPTRPEARLVNGLYHSVALRDSSAALEQYRLGLEVQPNNIDLLAAATNVERSLGRFDDAVAHAQQAARLDPRSVIAGATLARIYHDTHRLAEADKEYARTLAMSPGNLRIVQGRAANCLSQGDLAAARAVIAAALPHVERKALIVRFATFQEMMWVLPDDMRAEVVELQPADFDKDRGMWALKVGATYMMMNDVGKARSYGRISADEYALAVRRFPDDPQRVELLGRALVLAGDSKGAIEAGERSLALRATKMDAINGPYYKYQVSRIYIQAGQYDRALELLEPLLSQPGDLTPGWLRVDPVFKPLHGNPRFDRLTAGS